jgi:hypothetical protein
VVGRSDLFTATCQIYSLQIFDFMRVIGKYKHLHDLGSFGGPQTEKPRRLAGAAISFLDPIS